ncbi:MAG: ATP-binding cassette domain-containing protein [Chlamydiales bacterium]|nr:ATP-binding cassette domain-containing protein [Chlamydiales bacterium]NCF71744.1 ATP-binding cassette domain-containing protein [Chlamydiales bacterium]
MSKKQVPLLEVKNLKKHFPIQSGVFKKTVGWVKAVDGVSFQLKKGEILGLVGESGCGKSTLGRAAIRLIEPTSGNIYFQGKDFLGKSSRELRQVRKDIQVVFQNPYASLNPRKTIAVNVGEAALYHGLVKTIKERDEYVVDILESVGLSSEALNRYPHEFSGGQQQRVCIGRAIALKPKLIICDEAISALDVSIQAQILNLLYELKRKHDLSYLFISHDLSVVEHFCDNIMVLYFGKLVEYGPAKEVFENPKQAYTKRLIASIPSLKKIYDL